MSERSRSFEPYRDEIWKALEARLGDEGGWEGERLDVSAGPYQVALDVRPPLAPRGSELVTRLRAAFVNPDGFRFAISRHSFLADLATFLGRRDIVVDDEEFDREFVVRANDVMTMKRVLADGPTRRSLLESRELALLRVREDEGWFGRSLPLEVDELYLESEGRVTDAEAVARLFHAFARVLRRLTTLGSAYESDVRLE